LHHFNPDTASAEHDFSNNFVNWLGCVECFPLQRNGFLPELWLYAADFSFSIPIFCIFNSFFSTVVGFFSNLIYLCSPKSNNSIFSQNKKGEIHAHP
jgi:hypothetical protein